MNYCTQLNCVQVKIDPFVPTRVGKPAGAGYRGQRQLEWVSNNRQKMGRSGSANDAGQLRLHALEQRAILFGVQVADMDAKVLCGDRVQYQQGGAGIGQDVLARLVQKLEG